MTGHQTGSDRHRADRANQGTLKPHDRVATSTARQREPSEARSAHGLNICLRPVPAPETYQAARASCSVGNETEAMATTQIDSPNTGSEPGRDTALEIWPRDLRVEAELHHVPSSNNLWLAQQRLASDALKPETNDRYFHAVPHFVPGYAKQIQFVRYRRAGACRHRWSLG